MGGIPWTDRFSTDGPPMLISYFNCVLASFPCNQSQVHNYILIDSCVYAKRTNQVRSIPDFVDRFSSLEWQRAIRDPCVNRCPTFITGRHRRVHDSDANSLFQWELRVVLRGSTHGAGDSVVERCP